MDAHCSEEVVQNADAGGARRHRLLVARAAWPGAQPDLLSSTAGAHDAKARPNPPRPSPYLRREGLDYSAVPEIDVRASVGPGDLERTRCGRR